MVVTAAFCCTAVPLTGTGTDWELTVKEVPLVKEERARENQVTGACAHAAEYPNATHSTSAKHYTLLPSYPLPLPLRAGLGVRGSVWCAFVVTTFMCVFLCVLGLFFQYYPVFTDPF